MRYLTILTSLLLFLGAIAMNLTESKGLPVRTAFRASQPLDEPRRTILNINNITTWVEDNGLFPTITHEWRNGTYPKGTAGVIYAEGIVWGGKVNDGRRSSLRVGGSTYESGLVAGAILADATGNVIGREDVNSSDVRAYRVRPDWAAADLREDAASLFMKKAEQVTDVEIAELRIQYEKDWNEWPAHKGAPFEDRNGDGDYNPAVDVPGIPGAGQTIWYVANDLDSAKTYTFAGAPPTGLEMQMTLWAYHLPESHPLGNVSFKRVRLIYKGTPSTPTDATIDSMYIGQWADSDIGNAGDDYVGCDTLLALVP